ncbi:TrmH family RNA methyltransferase [Rhizobium halophytocola]|uniref:tRNA G18 (Ribose-2'-O)-methylase SpoU n=1 Tax=Rhizobium halophytocola TaxID=735519 RepID=A0ABS4DSR4_9HYPH|nr:RNA methyltransferase [Rhizobium halophytocola]MBP1848725.1 tRNA G18 (ribose-2'-O)-methylase SpoU [Rhizobium halophytocola]
MAGPLIRIEDAADPRIAEFRDIRERDLTGRQGRFIAEGTVVLRVLSQVHAASTNANPQTPSARFVAEKLLLLENRVDGLEDLLAAFPEEVPVYVARSALLDAIAGFPLHRGVLALGRREAQPENHTFLGCLPETALVVAACGISNHDNIGGIFRNAAALGADAVLLDETCCDPLYRKALRVSVGGVMKVPYRRGNAIEANLAALAEAGFSILALSPAGRSEIGDVAASGRVALVLGTEGEGLSPSVLQRFDTARIAQSPSMDSLNVGVAGGIALYTLARKLGRI